MAVLSWCKQNGLDLKEREKVRKCLPESFTGQSNAVLFPEHA